MKLLRSEVVRFSRTVKLLAMRAVAGHCVPSISDRERSDLYTLSENAKRSREERGLIFGSAENGGMGVFLVRP